MVLPCWWCAGVRVWYCVARVGCAADPLTAVPLCRCGAVQPVPVCRCGVPHCRAAVCPCQPAVRAACGCAGWFRRRPFMCRRRPFLCRRRPFLCRRRPFERRSKKREQCRSSPQESGSNPELRHSLSLGHFFLARALLLVKKSRMEKRIDTLLSSVRSGG